MRKSPSRGNGLRSAEAHETPLRREKPFLIAPSWSLANRSSPLLWPGLRTWVASPCSLRCEKSEMQCRTILSPVKTTGNQRFPDPTSWTFFC